MKRIYILILLATCLVTTVTFAQTAVSERAVIHIDNSGTFLPSIKLIEPGDLVKDKEVTRQNEELKIYGRLLNGNGKQLIIVNNVPATIYGDSIFSVNLALVPGSNPIQIDVLSENSVVNRYNYKVFRIVNQVNLVGPGKTLGKYYALIIGIDKYSDPKFNELDFCIRDAQQFYNAITSRYIFDKEDVKFLKNATMAQLVESLDFYAKKVRPEDSFLIFFAGHGVWDKTSETGFWLTSDARNNSKLAWFRNSTLRDYLKEIHSKHTLLISDACFGGSIFKSRSAFIDAPLAINKLYELPSRKAMTSGTLTEVPDQSAFLKYLVERLNQNNEKYLSSEQLFSSFRIAVMNNSTVTPQYGEIKEVGDEGGDFIFILKDDKTEINFRSINK